MKARSHLKTLLGGLKEFPAELLTGAVLGVGAGIGHDEFHFVAYAPWVVLLCIAALCLNRWTRGRGPWRVAYWLVPVAALAVVLSGFEAPSLALLLAAALLLVIPGVRSAEEYRRAAWNSTLWTLIPFGIGLGVMALALLTLWSVHLLFGVDIDRASVWALIAIFYLLVPLMCCTAITRRLQHEPGNMARVVADYIVAPFSALYTLVLFAYVAYIVVGWQLPDGGVAWMVSVYVVLSLIGAMLHREGENRVVERYYRLQPLLALLPIGLMWVGVVRRVADYGWTADRIILVAMSLLLTVADLAAAMQRLCRNYRAYMLAVAAVCTLFSFAPWVNARSLGIRAQQARLHRVLPAVVDPATGRFAVEFNYNALAADPLRADSVVQADAALDYLRAEMDTAAFRQAYGQYGNYLNFSRWKLSEAQGDTTEGVEGVVHPIFDVELNHTVDLGPYTRYCPAASRMMRKGGVMDITIDGERVLSYPIWARADSLLQAYGQVAADSLLLYRTADYMLVIHSAWTYSENDISVRDISLFSR